VSAQRGQQQGAAHGMAEAYTGLRFELFLFDTLLLGE
jgi:hypothetical protein